MEENLDKNQSHDNNEKVTLVETVKQKRLILPSEYYNEAKDTVIYRLSELIFGSLLASFVLGFVGFTGYGFIEENGFITFSLTSLRYLFISATFTYFTAGLYLYYHTGILTTKRRRHPGAL